MRIRPLLTSLSLILLIAFSAAADTNLIQVTTTDPMEMMGRKMPGRTDTASVWFGEDKMSMNSEQMRAIVRNDRDLFYILMPEKRQYVEFSLSMFSSVADSAAEKIEAVVSAKVTVSDSTKNIGPWKCRKYLVDLTLMMGMKSTQEIWATEDIDLDYFSLAAASSGMMAAFEGYDDMINEMRKIKGVPVETRTSLTVMGATVNSLIEVVLIVTKEPPAGTYDLPEGYTKVDPKQLSPH